MDSPVTSVMTIWSASGCLLLQYSAGGALWLLFRSPPCSPSSSPPPSSTVGFKDLADLAEELRLLSVAWEWVGLWTLGDFIGFSGDSSTERCWETFEGGWLPVRGIFDDGGEVGDSEPLLGESAEEPWCETGLVFGVVVIVTPIFPDSLQKSGSSII